MPEASTSVPRELVRLALAEDLGDAGDVTSVATVPADAPGGADFVARAEGVVAGLQVVVEVCAQVDPAVAVTLVARDGDTVGPGQVVASMTGPARSLLAAERTALNFLTHLSGVATQTAAWVRAVQQTGCVVRDTRKTLPGLRLLQKQAVAAGGGTNHRAGLYDALLVKDNHVAAAGGITAATKAALDGAGGRPIQIEVDTLAQLDEALAAGARSVLLDNFGLDDTREAVRRCRALAEPVFVEASGGLTLERAAQVAAAGVDALAVGALTHSVHALDIGLDWHPPVGLGAT